MAEEVWLGWDTATSEVVMEMAGLLIHGQLEGLRRALLGGWDEPAIGGCAVA